MAKSKRMYMCDFETTTDPADCRVWAACAVDMETGEVAHLSNSIESFIKWILDTGSCKLYFHNLRFDGEFIMSWLLRNGFRHISNETRAIPEGCFKTLINDVGAFYKISICFKRKGKRIILCEIQDSLKKLPFPVRKIAKDFGLSMAKGEIDYTLPRHPGWEITDEEQEYIRTDCQIVQQALKFQLDEGMLKMTIASDSLNYYKQIMGNRFEYWFPVLPKELDDDLRKAYKGGFTWCNPRYQGQTVMGGCVFDVNSLYPYCMRHKLLPYGYPVFFEGKYEPDEKYPLHISRIRCAFRVKPGHIPCVQIKGSYFAETEYLTSSEVMMDDGTMDMVAIELTMTSVDLALLLDHYDVFDMEYISGFKFKAQYGMFDEYIDHWMEVKKTAPAGSAQRAIAKLYLNSLYGKFASSTEQLSSIPYLAPDGVVRYYKRFEPKRDKRGELMFDALGRLELERDEEGRPVPVQPEIIDPVYTPVGCFITAWARDKTIRSAQAVYDRFIYADTDSLHLEGTELPEGLEVHPVNLGAWKHEGNFTRGKFIRAKTYMEEIDGQVHVTCAGMPDNVKYYDPNDPGDRPEYHPTWETFERGAKFPGKLLPKRVPGGVVLVPVDFTIKL